MARAARYFLMLAIAGLCTELEPAAAAPVAAKASVRKQESRPLTPGQLIAGTLAYSQGNHASAFVLLMPFAERGTAQAQLLIGEMYQRGDGVPKSDGQAAIWFRKAAEQGNAAAQNALGMAYLQGTGVAWSLDQARHWLKLSAAQGNVNAQINLGESYAPWGRYSRDEAAAILWFGKAAEQGHPHAMLNLGMIYGSQPMLVRDWSEAYKWLTLAMAYSKDWQTRQAAENARDNLFKNMAPKYYYEAMKRVEQWKPK